MLTTLHLNEKSKEVCIKAKSPAASEETAFSRTKVYFNANDEGTILQYNRNISLVKRRHLEELCKVKNSEQIVRSVRNTKLGRLIWPST